MDISVIIPVYGCKSALTVLYERISATLTALGLSYEIILVNDACPQGSWQVVTALCEQDSRVIGVELSRNFGQIRAITAGLDISRGEHIVVMDCDLQDPPEHIASLWHKAQEGYDVVFVRRVGRKSGAIGTFLSRQFYRVLGFLTGSSFDPDISNFSLCTRQVIDAYLTMREQKRAYVIFLRWLGFNSTVIEIEQDSRFEGKSSYSLRKRLTLAMEIITAQSTKVLHLSIAMGAAMALISLLIALYAFISYFVASEVLSGWTSTIIATLFVGGLILINIGVLGIYIGNIFDEQKKRPLYVIRTLLNEPKEG